MTELFIYNAECGDAGRLRFLGKDGKLHNFFIDGGFERTFRTMLKAEIKSLLKQGEVIDTWAVSHIHDDHIGGVIAYVKSVLSGELEDRVTTWYYNYPRPPKIKSSLQEISTAKSIAQGDKVTEYLHATDALPSTDITSELSELDLSGLKIQFLSPNMEGLAQLRNKYPAGSLIPLEREEGESISEAKAAIQSDYHHQLQTIDLSKWVEDASIENNSSLSFILELDNKKILWLGDALPRTVVEKLRSLGYSNANPLKCEWVKVSHHGSSGNNSSELFDMIRCNNYLFTANGENKHRLPTKECIARILLNSQRPPDSYYHIYFTDDNPTLRKIFEVDGSEVTEKFKFTIHYLPRTQNSWHLKF